MSDDKLNRILTMLEAQGADIEAIKKRQVEDFGMLTGALEGLSTDLADARADLGDEIAALALSRTA